MASMHYKRSKKTKEHYYKTNKQKDKVLSEKYLNSVHIKSNVSFVAITFLPSLKLQDFLQEPTDLFLWTERQKRFS